MPCYEQQSLMVQQVREGLHKMPAYTPDSGCLIQPSYDVHTEYAYDMSHNVSMY